MEISYISCSNTPTNLGPFSVFKSAGSDNFKTHPHVQFDQVLAEIFEVKDKWLESFISMMIDLLDMKITEIWTICSKNCSAQH